MAPWLLAGVLICLLPVAAGLPSVQVAATVDASDVAGAAPGVVPPADAFGAADHAVSTLTGDEALEGLGDALHTDALGAALDAPLRTSSLDVPALQGSPLPGDSPLASPEARVAAGVSAAAGLAMAGLLRPFLAFAPLYARLDRNALLEHPVRRELVRRIEADPGVNVSDLHVGLDLGWGSLLYHLQRLEGQGLVMSHRWGRSRRYFMNQRGLATRAEAIRALKAPNARTLATLVAAHPGQTQEELAQAMALSKSVVSKYAKRLADARLVQREVGRNCLRLFPTAELRELLHTMPTVEAGPAVPEAAPGPVAAAPVAVVSRASVVVAAARPVAEPAQPPYAHA